MDATTLIIVLIVVLATLVLIPVVLLQGRAQVRAWSELAAKLGLACNRKGRPQSPVWLQGEYQGYPVIMDTYMETRSYRSGSRRQATVDTFTRIIMRVSNPAGLRLELSKEGTLAKVAQRLGVQDIQVGDAALDGRLSIKGEPEETVRRLLTAEAIRQPLLSAAKLDVRLEGEELTYRLPGVEKNGERLRSAFDLLTALATEVTRAG